MKTASAPFSKVVTLGELQHDLAAILDIAMSGETVLIMDGDVPLAELGPSQIKKLRTIPSFEDEADPNFDYGAIDLVESDPDIVRMFEEAAVKDFESGRADDKFPSES